MGKRQRHRRQSQPKCASCQRKVEWGPYVTFLHDERLYSMSWILHSVCYHELRKCTKCNQKRLVNSNYCLHCGFHTPYWDIRF